MEFFEKAHVVRGSDSKNSDDVVKRQLRQMLYGYKQSDNEIIKHSIDLDNEDSSSVSGFSDLNLTSSEVDTSKETRGSIDDIIKKSVFNDSVDLHNDNNVDLTLRDPDREEGSPRSASDDSSEIFLDVGGYCLRNRQVINSTDLDLKSIDYNSDKSVSDIMTSAEDSILFDADGQLASKIRGEINRKRKVQSDGNKKNVDKQVKYHHITISEDSSEDSNLGKKEHIKSKSRYKTETTLANEGDNIINNEEIVKQKKQKIKNKLKKIIDKEILNSDTSSYSDEYVNIRQREKPKIESKKKTKGRLHSVLLENFRDYRDGDIESENNNNHSNETVIKELDETDCFADEEVEKTNNSSIAFTETTSNSSIIDIIDASSPFVSMSVSEMSVLSFNEILGNYKHATMQNVPSQNQRVTFLTKDFEDYSIADQNNEIVIEEADIPTEDNSVCELSCDTVESVNNDVSNVTTDDITNIILDEESQSEETFSETSPIDNDSDLNDQVQAYYSRDNCVMVLRHPGQIFIHGKVQIKALGGTAEVFGYTLNDKLSEIYAPYTDYAMCIKSVQNDNVYYGLFAKLTGLGLSVIEAETIVTTLGEYDVVLSLKSLKKQRIDFVEKSFTIANLFKKRKFDLNCLQSASNYLECSIYSNTPPKIFKDKGWDEIVNQECDKKSIGLVCGGKGVGKSTFLRYYVNRQLRHGPILVIDLDPGQCEFTAAGNISASVITEPLLGPNFTHLKTPEKMLNIGIINTMDNPRRYINAVIDLISYCRSFLQFRNMPWIVNTMGMTNAMGLEFITLTILNLQPTFLLQINSVNEKKGFGLQLDSNTVHELYMKRYQRKLLFKNVCQEELHYNFYNVDKTHTIKNKTSMAPRDERYLNFLAYFGEALEMGPEKGLLEITPYQVHLTTLNVACNVDIRRESIMRVLNGKIVALCQQNTNERGKVFALSDKPLLCHGHGLVRGIDFDTGVLYITSPILMERLILVNTLLYADWVPELLGQERHLPQSTTLPYRTATDYQQRQLMLSTGRRFNPVLQLKMSRRS